jgi:hypothetical protein
MNSDPETNTDDADPPPTRQEKELPLPPIETEPEEYTEQPSNQP